MTPILYVTIALVTFFVLHKLAPKALDAPASLMPIVMLAGFWPITLVFIFVSLIVFYLSAFMED